MANLSSPDALLALAKKQLNYSSIAPNTVVLDALIEELKKHIMLYEDDINFTVHLQPGSGFGVVTCLEKGCNNERINLVQRVSARDGGLLSGFGSLSAYRVHIEQHATHKKERLRRVKAVLGIKREEAPPLLSSSPAASTGSSSLSILHRKYTIPSAAKKSSILEALDNSSKPSTPNNHLVRQALTRSACTSSNASKAPVVKSEPEMTPLSKKRPSEMSLSGQGSQQHSRTPIYKKPKLEDLPPVSQPKPNPSTALAVAKSAMANQEDMSSIRQRLKDIQSELLHIAGLRAKTNRKMAKTKADLTRIAKYDKQMRDLEKQKDECNAALPSLKPLSRSNSIPGVPAASRSNAQLQHAALLHISPAAYNQAILPPPVASGSSVKLEEATGEFMRDQIATGLALGHYDDYDDDYDAQGNWHGRGRDGFRGPVAKADDIDQFLLNAGNAENFDGNTTVAGALKKLGLDSLVRPLPGMEIALMPHQAIGVAWMLNKENTVNKGGILADEMGLGKTVQMISVIATNRSEDPLRKTTLIIAPVALLDQWQLEIDMKTNLGLKSLIYHGNNKPKKAEDMKKYDIVLTTYHTLALEWPDPELEEKEKKNKGRKTDERAVVKFKKRKSPGLLFQVEFHRICIDEAQNIRNKRTRVSRAVTELRAKYRWCLTGTPIINSLSDAYGLLRFLRIRPWYDWDDFNKQISRLEKKRPDLASTKLQTIFATTLLRRKKDSMLDGKPLITLPAKNVNLQKLQFSAEERAIYNMVEAKSQNIFNRFLRAGTVLKNYSQVLVMLLRLRQICSHPSLIQEGGVAFVGPDEFTVSSGGHDKHAELTRAARLVSQEFVERMKSKLKETILERMAAEKESADASIEGEECPICYDTFTEPVVTSCTHVFCRECIGNVLSAAPRQDANEPNRYKADERPCPTCRGAICHEKLFSRNAFEPTDAELATATGRIIKDEDDDIIMVDDMVDVKGKGKAKALPGRALPLRRARVTSRVIDSDEEPSEDEDDEDETLSDFIVDDDDMDDDDYEERRDARREARRSSRKKGNVRAAARRVVLSDDEDEAIIYGAKPVVDIPKEKIALLPKFLPSTKMKHMMESLRSWVETHPDEKTLIISQWTHCLSLVSDYLTEHGFLHVKYQGDMLRSQRDAAVRAFMSKDKATVMLMSLKCGGVGLNLTRANRVISLDLGWSSAIESQAFDRVHRLGQQREVFVERLVISDTVEDRVLALQDRKKNLADGSLGEGTGKKVGRLSVKELANLFGLDHRGHVL